MFSYQVEMGLPEWRRPEHVRCREEQSQGIQLDQETRHHHETGANL